MNLRFRRIIILVLLLMLCFTVLIVYKTFRYSTVKYELYTMRDDSEPRSYNAIYVKKNKLNITYIGYGGRIIAFNKGEKFPKPSDDYSTFINRTEKLRIIDIKEKMLICRCVLVGENIGKNNIMFNFICDTVLCGCPTDTVYYRAVNDTLICDYPFDCIEYTIKNNGPKISKFLIDKESKLIIESKALYEGSNSFVTEKKLVGVKEVSNSYFDSLYKSTTNVKEFIEFEAF